MRNGIQTVLMVGMAAFGGAASADVITQWNFNGASTTTVPGGITSPTPSTGAGTAGLLGGVTGGFNSGTANGGSSDPVTTSPPNYGWQTTTYAAQGAENGGRGVQFAVSTAGFRDIYITFDARHSNTSSRFLRVDWSSNGGSSWNSGAVFEAASGGDTWYNNRDSGLLPAAANNNANFMCRIVAVFSPAAGQYVAATPTAAYAASGTVRFDMVTVHGVVPTPGSLAMLAMGGLVATRRRR